MKIHPTAIVEEGSEIGEGATIGPYCVIGPSVQIGSGCHLISHVSVVGDTVVGAGTSIRPFASLGSPPQSAGYNRERTKLIVGANCDIRESVTMNLGTTAGGGLTRVGDRGFFMANSHVGHDCHVGNDVVFANCASVGGHCVIGDNVFIGALSGVHQRTRIGANAIIGGVSGVREDVIPFGLAAGAFARLSGINLVGMRRRKYSAIEIARTRSAYKILFLSKDTLANRIAEARETYSDVAPVRDILSFIQAKNGRPICSAVRGGD